MTWYHILLLALGISYFVGAVYQSFQIIATWLWVKRKSDLPADTIEDAPTIVLIIPVLREQNTIAKTLRHLTSLNYPTTRLSVVVVTTERETRENSEAMTRLKELGDWTSSGETPESIIQKLPGLGPPSLVIPILSQFRTHRTQLQKALTSLPSTADVIDSLLPRLTKDLTIRRVHYPYISGAMAHQMNWGIRYVFEVVDRGMDADKTWIALYNADSQPHRDSLAHLAAQIQRYAQSNSALPIAFQQHSTYSSKQGNLISAAAAAWQTRWSLAVEHSRARLATALWLWLANKPYHWGARLIFNLCCPFNYAIGHGLFMRLREVVQMNYLPESTANEDAAFGYLMIYSGNVLLPLPVFDCAEAPGNARMLLAQQSGWFRGPLDGAVYRRLAKARGASPLGFPLEYTLTARVWWDAAIWIFGPVAAVIILCSFLADPAWEAGLGLVTFLFYLTIPTCLSQTLAPWSSDRKKPETILVIAVMPLFYLLHGFAPILYLAKMMRAWSKGETVPKYKTER
jgi:cellulose synthase/poly-beta-1,6-N-acetylglucosamine synthase-like glycosyltransferase